MTPVFAKCTVEVDIEDTFDPISNTVVEFAENSLPSLTLRASSPISNELNNGAFPCMEDRLILTTDAMCILNQPYIGYCIKT
jgi:hypothetical protein